MDGRMFSNLQLVNSNPNFNININLNHNNFNHNHLFNNTMQDNFNNNNHLMNNNFNFNNFNLINNNYVPDCFFEMGTTTFSPTLFKETQEILSHCSYPECLSLVKQCILAGTWGSSEGVCSDIIQPNQQLKNSEVDQFMRNYNQLVRLELKECHEMEKKLDKLLDEDFQVFKKQMDECVHSENLRHKKPHQNSFGHQNEKEGGGGGGGAGRGGRGDTFSEMKENLKKRENLPKRAVKLLQSWIVERMKNPYPTEKEKDDLSKLTGLSITQINNWFVNARRRKLRPLLEAFRTTGPLSVEQFQYCFQTSN